MIERYPLDVLAKGGWYVAVKQSQAAAFKACQPSPIDGSLWR